ncbi:MAG: hypothetical protein GWO24_04035, partial [Akkermansiaceae bacterium]|nr:hypothetical protein [Akkermansiaceae bacterium]
KAANEGLTAPATPLHDLRPKKPAEKKTKSPVPKFASDYGVEIDSLKPVVHARLDAKPEAVVLEKGVEISDKEFARLKEGRLRIDTPIPADN